MVSFYRIDGAYRIGSTTYPADEVLLRWSGDYLRILDERGQAITANLKYDQYSDEDGQAYASAAALKDAAVSANITATVSGTVDIGSPVTVEATAPLPAQISGVDPDGVVREVRTDEGGRVTLSGGSLFGDDQVTTHRVSTMGAKWSQGLPVGLVTITNSGTKGFWEVLADPGAPGSLDGACAVGIDAGGGASESYIISTVKPNRYFAGHLSYYGFTFAVDFSGANGDCEIGIGCLVRGARTENRLSDIKGGFFIVAKRIGGVVTKVLRGYKNYVQTFELEITHEYDLTHLQIHELQVGYYGIHPVIVKLVVPDDSGLSASRHTIAFKAFEQFYTSVADPNMVMGVFVKNQGNTGKIQMFNGSIESGNYWTTPPALDSAARFISKIVSVDTTTATTNDAAVNAANGLIGAFRVPDIISMIKRVDNSGNTFANFRNTIVNQLLYFRGAGTPQTASRIIYVNIYILPAQYVTATFADISAGYSVLQFATAAQISSYDLTKAVATHRERLTSAGFDRSLTDREIALRPDFAAIITLTAASTNTTVTDISLTFETKDLF